MPRAEISTGSEDKIPNQKKTDDSAQDKERRVFIPGETERKRNKQVLTSILLGIPIVWDTHSDQCLKDILGALNIPTYYPIKNALSDLISKYQLCVKRYLEGFPFLSLCCDGWSVVKPAKSMGVFFVTVFKVNVFKSVLIDCMSMDRSASTDLVDKLEMEYNLPASAMITTDGASNNNKAFENQRACYQYGLAIRRVTQTKHLLLKRPYLRNHLIYERISLLLIQRRMSAFL